MNGLPALTNVDLTHRLLPFDDSLASTVEWYRDNRAWWEPLKRKAGL